MAGIGNVRLEFHRGWPRVPNQPLLVGDLRANVTQAGKTQPQTPKGCLVGKSGDGGRYRGLGCVSKRQFSMEVMEIQEMDGII